jgi:Ca-activated chloride channel family protein
MRLGIWAAAVVAWLLCPAWCAQRDVPSGSGAPTVLLRASVVDKSGNPVTNLPREAFKVFEDGVEQKLQVFRLEDGPMSIGVLVDVSASMKSIAANLRSAVERFAGTAGPQNEFFLVEFNNEAYLEVPRTTDAGKLVSRVGLQGFRGGSALLDAVHEAAVYLREARNPRKALLVLSDGADNMGQYTKAGVENLLQREDVQVYCIGISPEPRPGVPAREFPPARRLLEELSSPTGGLLLPSIKPKDLADAAARIGSQMRSGYVLGYSPANQKSGAKRGRPTVKLELPRGSPPLRVTTGPGPKAPPR